MSTDSDEARQKPLSPLSAAALRDVLAFPFRGGALAVLVVLLALRLPAAMLPLFLAPIGQLLLWLALYKYALEAMATAAQGRIAPPDVLSNIDDSVHRRHIGVQFLLLVGLSALLILAPDWKLSVSLGIALVLPGFILALAVSQNLLGALNPLNWAVVAARLGPGYVLLALAWWGLLFTQLDAANWLAGLPGLVAAAIFYPVTHYLVLALFRWMGLFLHAGAASLGFEVKQNVKPVLVRDRQDAAVRRGIANARLTDDPALRAEQLREAVRLGAEEPVHRDYRQALRDSGNRKALNEHAQVHASELLVLGKLREARLLVSEALEDDAAFSLPESGPLLVLLDALEQAAQWRTAASLAINYRHAFPKRRDSHLLVQRAAGILADQLSDPAQAGQLLDAAITQAQAWGEDEALTTLRKRLDSGMRLRTSAAAPGSA